jgi:hypothetical protein
LARVGWGKHATQVNTSTYPDDGSSPIGSNEWNEAPSPAGMLGFTESTKTIATGAITPVDTATVVAAESGITDNLDFITYSETSVNDVILLYADTGDTITVRHNQSPGSGQAAIDTVSDDNITLSETIPLVLQRRGTTFYQIIENSISAVTASSTITFTNKTINGNDNNITIVASNLSDFDSAVAGNSAVTANTAKTGITSGQATAITANTAKITYPSADSTKLAGIEASATADQTNAEIRTAVEAATDSNVFVDADHTKLNAIEASADVTDATNVNAAGALMLSDTSTSGLGIVIDEDAMGSNSATKVPTQQSVKAYVDSVSASDISLQGDYNASTNSPDLDTSPSGILKGDHYVVSVAGTFFSESLQAGDSVISKQDDPTTFAHWIVTNNNLTTPISNAEVSASAAIDATKIADGTVTSTEFQYINSLSSNAQTQIDTKSPAASPTFTGTVTTAAVDVAGNDIDNIQNLIMDTSASGTDIDFAEDQLQTISIAANTTFTTANRAIGKTKTIKITTDATLRTLTFPSWKFVGTMPTEQAASKIAILTVTCFGTADTDIVAAYAAEE